MPSVADHEFLRSPQSFGTVLADLRVPVGGEPPGDDDLDDLAGGCLGFIEALYAWETATHGQDVTDTKRGPINTAEARRMLAQEVALSHEGDIAVLLVRGDHNSVRVELHAEVDEFQGLLCRTSLALAWEHGGEDHERWYSLKRKGAHWYMLAQLRDDLREDRLVQT